MVKAIARSVAVFDEEKFFPDSFSHGTSELSLRFYTGIGLMSCHQEVELL